MSQTPSIRFVLHHKNARVEHGSVGVYFVSDGAIMMKTHTTITFRGLLSTINKKLNLAAHEYVSSISYMYNISTDRIFFTSVGVGNDEDVQMMIQSAISDAVKSISLLLTIDRVVDATTQHRVAESSHQLRGDWESSYTNLPQLFTAIRHYIPGSVTDMQLLDMPPFGGSGDFKYFHRCFWTFGPCIVGFNHCIPIVQICSTFLCGKYNGTLLVATSIDGNKNIFPLAFALVESENHSSWSYFLHAIRRYVTQRTNICLISNRHVGILSAIASDPLWQPPNAVHRFCVRHIASNLNKAIENTKIQKHFYAAAKKTQVHKFRKMKCDLLSFQGEVAAPLRQFLSSLNDEQWTRSMDGGYRYGHMTTNAVESVNGMLKGVRTLSVTAIVNHTLSRVVHYFQFRKHKIQSQQSKGLTHSRWVRRKIQKKIAKSCNGYTPEVYDREKLTFQVLPRQRVVSGVPSYKQTVCLTEGHCTCGKWQVYKYPCTHAMVCCRFYSLNYNNYISPYFRLERILQAYAERFYPLGHQAYWPQYNGPIVKVNPETKRANGIPKST